MKDALWDLLISKDTFTLVSPIFLRIIDVRSLFSFQKKHLLSDPILYRTHSRTKPCYFTRFVPKEIFIRKDVFWERHRFDSENYTKIFFSVKVVSRYRGTFYIILWVNFQVPFLVITSSGPAARLGYLQERASVSRSAVPHLNRNAIIAYTKEYSTKCIEREINGGGGIR